MKILIINADDFGYSKANNIAIQKGVQSGIITSAGLMANMDGFEHAATEVLPTIQVDVGIHLNIIEGKSLTNQPLLCDKNGNFNNSYCALILKSANDEFLKQTETEFRAQIEKVLKHTKASHVDSHVHTHAIPPIFKLVQKLAEEYNIPFIRTQNEIPYRVEGKPIDQRFLINIIKNILLNAFSFVNRKNNIKTNDYFIGVLYTGNMTEQTIIEGLKKVKDNSVTEVIFHPTVDESKKDNYREFLITQNPSFKEYLKNSGFSQSTYNENNV